MFFGFGKKKKDSLDQAFDKTFEEITRLDSWNDPKKLERYILDSCEQIVSVTKEIEAEKKEYRIVTNYLKDIDTLEKLPDDEREKLKNLAASLVELTRARVNFESRNRRISEKAYMIIEENEEDMPATIERLIQNEKYQDTLAKDMRHLEGEKSVIIIDRETFKNSLKVQRIIAIVLFAAFFLVSMSMFAYEYVTNNDMQWLQLLLLLFAASSFAMLFIRATTVQRRNKRALKYLNKIIPMLNSVRMKYANITNAVNYVYSKFNVKSAKELELLWNNYQIEKRDRETNDRNNQDIELCNDRFMDFLKSKHLYDAKVWQFQAQALVTPEEMVEVRHRLVARRQKIRDQINSNTKAVKMERDEIDKIMQEHNFYVPEIIEIIQSVDRLCGLNQYKERTPGAEQGRLRRQ